MSAAMEGTAAAEDPWFGRMNDPTAAARMVMQVGFSSADGFQEACAEAMIFPNLGTKTIAETP